MIEIVHAIFRPEIIAPIMIFGMPVMIVASTQYFKLQKLKLERSAMNADELRLLKKSLVESESLKERVSNLEAIITSLDKEILALKAADVDDAAQVKTLSDKMKQ